MTNSWTSSAAILNFTIPQWVAWTDGKDWVDGKDWKDWTDWQDGAAATITVWTTTTWSPWTNASVTNTWTSSAAVFDFTIPQWATGATWNWVASITSSKVWKITTVTITETNWDSESFTVSDWADWQWAWDVVWPNSATDWHLAVFDWATWKLIKDWWSVPTWFNPWAWTTWQVLKKTNDWYWWANESWAVTSVNWQTWAVTLTIPSDTGDLTNGAWFITWISGWDVTTALWYTPANSANLWTAAACNTWTSSGNVPILDSNWKLATSTLPWVALTDTFTVSTSADLTTLSSADQWDIAIVTSENKTYVLSVAPYSTASNWKEILAPTWWVTSVNWNTWAVTVNEFSPSNAWSTDQVLTKTASWYERANAAWSDYSWVTKTISGWEVELWLRTIVNVPTSNFTLTAPATLKDWEEYAIRIISETSYTMTLWTWFTNPRNVDTTLSGNATDQYVFLAIWGELELQPLVDTWA